MNPADIMAEVAEVLGGLPGIRKSHGHPVGALGGFPAVVVGYPEEINYGVLSDDGHRLTVPAWVVVGGIIGRETAAKTGGYAGTGPDSAHAVLNGKTDWATCDDVTVVRSSTDVITIGDSDYLTVILTIDVAVTG